MKKIIQYYKNEEIEWALLSNGEVWKRHAYFSNTGGYLKSKEWSDWRLEDFPFLNEISANKKECKSFVLDGKVYNCSCFECF